MTCRIRCPFGLALLLVVPAGCVTHHGDESAEALRAGRESANPDLLVRRARAFALVGDFTRAEQYLNAALDHGADASKVYPLLLEVCVGDKRYRAAKQYVIHYLRRHPSATRLRFVLASLHVGLGEASEARRELERVIALDPRHAGAHFALAVLFRDSLGSTSRADAYFRRYLALEPRGAHADEARGSLVKSVQ